jgi:hypothetical protein
MRKILGLLMIMIASLALGLGLSGCQARPEMPAFNGVLTQSAPLGEVALAQAVEPTVAATADATPEAAVNECLACHSNKDQLIETADPVEPAGESESKGVG